MSKNMTYFEYKGYHTRIEFDYDSLSLFGKIEGIDDLILFESSDATKIEEEFHSAVDNYLTLCKEVGKTPEKEYKGVFNVRVTPELHRSLATIAFKQSETLNSVIEMALENYVDSVSALIETFSYSPVPSTDYMVKKVSSDSAYSDRFGEVC
jgi:predicted HicB family RNase H-like nuclease